MSYAKNQGASTAGHVVGSGGTDHATSAAEVLREDVPRGMQLPGAFPGETSGSNDVTDSHQTRGGASHYTHQTASREYDPASPSGHNSGAGIDDELSDEAELNSESAGSGGLLQTAKSFFTRGGSEDAGSATRGHRKSSSASGAIPSDRSRHLGVESHLEENEAEQTTHDTPSGTVSGGISSYIPGLSAGAAALGVGSAGAAKQGSLSENYKDVTPGFNERQIEENVVAPNDNANQRYTSLVDPYVDEKEVSQAKNLKNQKRLDRSSSSSSSSYGEKGQSGGKGQSDPTGAVGNTPQTVPKDEYTSREQYDTRNPMGSSGRTVDTSAASRQENQYAYGTSTSQAEDSAKKTAVAGAGVLGAAAGAAAGLAASVGLTGSGNTERESTTAAYGTTGKTAYPKNAGSTDVYGDEYGSKESAYHSQGIHGQEAGYGSHGSSGGSRGQDVNYGSTNASHSKDAAYGAGVAGVAGTGYAASRGGHKTQKSTDSDYTTNFQGYGDKRQTGYNTGVSKSNKHGSDEYAAAGATSRSQGGAHESGIDTKNVSGPNATKTEAAAAASAAYLGANQGPGKDYVPSQGTSSKRTAGNESPKKKSSFLDKITGKNKKDPALEGAYETSDPEMPSTRSDPRGQTNPSSHSHGKEAVGVAGVGATGVAAHEYGKGSGTSGTNTSGYPVGKSSGYDSANATGQKGVEPAYNSNQAATAHIPGTKGFSRGTTEPGYGGKVSGGAAGTGAGASAAGAGYATGSSQPSASSTNRYDGAEAYGTQKSTQGKYSSSGYGNPSGNVQSDAGFGSMEDRPQTLDPSIDNHGGSKASGGLLAGAAATLGLGGLLGAESKDTNDTSHISGSHTGAENVGKKSTDPGYVPASGQGDVYGSSVGRDSYGTSQTPEDPYGAATSNAGTTANTQASMKGGDAGFYNVDQTKGTSKGAKGGAAGGAIGAAGLAGAGAAYTSHQGGSDLKTTGMSGGKAAYDSYSKGNNSKGTQPDSQRFDENSKTALGSKAPNDNSGMSSQKYDQSGVSHNHGKSSVTGGTSGTAGAAGVGTAYNSNHGRGNLKSTGGTGGNIGRDDYSKDQAGFKNDVYGSKGATDSYTEPSTYDQAHGQTTSGDSQQTGYGKKSMAGGAIGSAGVAGAGAAYEAQKGGKGIQDTGISGGKAAYQDYSKSGTKDTYGSRTQPEYETSKPSTGIHRGQTESGDAYGTSGSAAAYGSTTSGKGASQDPRYSGTSHQKSSGHGNTAAGGALGAAGIAGAGAVYEAQKGGKNVQDTGIAGGKSAYQEYSKGNTNSTSQKDTGLAGGAVGGSGSQAGQKGPYSSNSGRTHDTTAYSQSEPTADDFPAAGGYDSRAAGQTGQHDSGATTGAATGAAAGGAGVYGANALARERGEPIAAPTSPSSADKKKKRGLFGFGKKKSSPPAERQGLSQRGTVFGEGSDQAHYAGDSSHGYGTTGAGTGSGTDAVAGTGAGAGVGAGAGALAGHHTQQKNTSEFGDGQHGGVLYTRDDINVQQIDPSEVTGTEAALVEAAARDAKKGNSGAFAYYKNDPKQGGIAAVVDDESGGLGKSQTSGTKPTPGGYSQQKSSTGHGQPSANPGYRQQPSTTGSLDPAAGGAIGGTGVNTTAHSTSTKADPRSTSYGQTQKGSSGYGQDQHPARYDQPNSSAPYGEDGKQNPAYGSYGVSHSYGQQNQVAGQDERVSSGNYGQQNQQSSGKGGALAGGALGTAAVAGGTAAYQAQQGGSNLKDSGVSGGKAAYQKYSEGNKSGKSGSGQSGYDDSSNTGKKEGFVPKIKRALKGDN